MTTATKTQPLTKSERRVLHDSFGRTIDYLRISLTDRCNLRCVYCMPKEGVPALAHEDILTLEEIVTLVTMAAKDGIKHIRLTGGEPLVRKGITELIRAIKHIDGIESVALTTNGILLPTLAKELKGAGLDRVNISLDSLDENQYHAITRRGTLADALAGIDAALEYGFDPVKINVVVVRHLEQNLVQFARLTMDRPLHVRFIEYMPIGKVDEGLPPAVPLTKTETEKELGTSNKSFIPWSDHDVIPATEIRQLLNDALEKEGLGKLIPLEGKNNNHSNGSNNSNVGDISHVSETLDTSFEILSKNPPNNEAPIGWGPATYYKIAGAKGTIGFISAISNHFCATCNRLRLTSDGKLRPCLFSDEEFDVKKPLRNGTVYGVQQILDEALASKPEGHHHRRGTKRSMSQMGG